MDNLKVDACAGIICSFCKKVKSEDGGWQEQEVEMDESKGGDFSHGFCPNCIQKNFGDLPFFSAQK